MSDHHMIIIIISPTLVIEIHFQHKLDEHHMIIMMIKGLGMHDMTGD